MSALPELIDLIDGERSTPAVGLGVWLEDPNTGIPTQEQRATSDDQLARALASAARAHETGVWARLPLEERAQYLTAMAMELDKRKARIAELEAATTGAVISLTSMLTVIVTGAWHLAVEQMRQGAAAKHMEGMNGNDVAIHRLPWGVALCLVPWNAPAPMAAHKVANALAAGCPTILKPTEWAPHGSDVFAEAAHAVGFPKGVFQIVHGNPRAGGILVKDRRVKAVSFTGGLEGGRAIAQACAYDFKPAQLELGGNNPVVVLEDADIDHAARGVVNLMVSLNGQWCRALGRLIVHERIADALLEAVLAVLAQVKVGHSLQTESQMGPLVHSRHLAKITGQLEGLLAKGGQAHRSTPLPDLGGHFFAPTLVTGVQPEDAQDEIFGPVGTVHTFRTDEEALALANGTPYGLEAYVFARDTERALALGRSIHAGGVKVNGSSMMSLNLFAPRPAWGWSGFSEEGTRETFEFFRGTRVIGVEENV
ncbi:aldehyde dehydrogenase family protein [Aggregatilineales bacterium SYSU G02658]